MTQEAYRARPISDEDKFFAQRDREIAEDLKRSREARGQVDRRCPCPECEGNILDRVIHDQIEIDRCSKCLGVWLDAGELDLLSGRATGSVNPVSKFFRNLAGDYSV